MNDSTGIAWTDATWNPVTGCTAVSAGCANCYAARLAATRLAGQPRYKGLAVLQADGGARWVGDVRLHADRLNDPLTRKGGDGRKVFVCNMSDLFHPDVPFDFVDRVFARMACQRGDTFQLLTKRPERAAEYFQHPERKPRVGAAVSDMLDGPWIWQRSNKHWRRIIDRLIDDFFEHPAEACGDHEPDPDVWPLRNVWVGASVEDQRTMEERTPWLRLIPAPVRFLSIEPLLGPITFVTAEPEANWTRNHLLGEAAFCGSRVPGLLRQQGRPINWAILGGESGERARPCDLDAMRAVVAQLDYAKVPVFVKQLGAWPYQDWRSLLGAPQPTPGAHRGAYPFLGLTHRKGEDPREWPTDLRRQEWPAAA